MSADRLAELLRQRALLREHLAWLEAEIAAASGPAATATAAPPHAAKQPAAPDARPPLSVAPALAANATPALAPTVAAATTPGLTEATVDAILGEYEVRPDNLRQDVRKGCLLYFAAAFVLLALGVLGLYFAFRRD